MRGREMELSQGMISDVVSCGEEACGRGVRMRWPRIALVTPVLNSRKYLEATIRSVLAQNYPNLDYFVVDGGSTDGTLEVIRKYESHLSGWISEPDDGMYDALNKGFARTSGEIMGWISGTDMLHVGGLLVVGSIFRALPDVEWITGRPTWFNEEGMTVGLQDLPRWSRYRFLACANRYIQQESTFWRRTLWDEAGSYVDASRRYAMDFELWVRFFRYAHLYSVDALIGGFRMHSDSLGLQDMERCHRIYDEVVEKELDHTAWGRSLRLFRRLDRLAKRIPKIRGLWQRLVTHSLYCRPGADWQPVIGYHNNQWILRRE
jgi:glycosyltransferase involved in cell wall biosynthesis